MSAAPTAHGDTVLNNLLPDVAAGRADAMVECLERYGSLVWSLARKACPTAQDAEDATQDIFLEVWKSASRFDSSIASETTFIATIARRRLIDRQRRRGRRVTEVQFAETVASTDAGETNTSATAQDASKVLSQLSDDQRRVLELSLVYGLSHDKIAKATGMPLGTVKTHARRGLIKARDLLSQQQSGDAS